MTDNVEHYLQQWRTERPDIDASPMGVLGRISRAQMFLGRELQKNFAAYGLQTYEFDILATLRRSGPPFRLTAGALVESSMVTSGAITHRIDRLAARELVSRETDPSNRRSVLITLTDSGRSLVDDVVVHHVDREKQLLSALDANEQEQLAALLRKLLLGLGDAAPSAPPAVPPA